MDVERSGSGHLPAPNAPIRSVELGEVTLDGGDEEGTLAALFEVLQRLDPDVLVTHGSDAFDVPHLYRRALSYGFNDTTFVLGRESVPFGLDRTGTSFESYGRILHRAPSFPLAGRFHLDIGEWFVEDVGIAGYIEMARLSRLGLQVVARRSPGTSFFSMELAVALADGVHIPWKKNFPEQEKSAATLVAADRGGFILTPPVGLAYGVDEFDFTSLYPSIMVEQNLSIETLECPCCAVTPHVAPGLGYRSCVLREGIVPKTLRPILRRRMYCKERKKATTGAQRAHYDDLCKAWKWVLVTSFGYQGYRNARFGRIEVHEAINAYAREILVALVDQARTEGWEVLHGIVDSHWLKLPPGADPEAFARTISTQTRHPLAYEGRYRWIVFLPNRAHGFGVPQRYYGSYVHGELKTRGIEVRRGDTCAMVRAVQQEVLDGLANSPDAAGFRDRIASSLDLGRQHADRISGGGVPLTELVLTHRVTKTLDEYRVFNEGVAALHQLRAFGVERAAGEEVSYVITDQHARDWRRKAVPAEVMRGDEAYDADAYVDLLARSFETLFIPFGWTLKKVREHWGYGPSRRGYGPNEHRSCQDPR
jgi:DNA polymerase elongation subunit (family B)